MNAMKSNHVPMAPLVGILVAMAAGTAEAQQDPGEAAAVPPPASPQLLTDWVSETMLDLQAKLADSGIANPVVAAGFAPINAQPGTRDYLRAIGTAHDIAMLQAFQNVAAATTIGGIKKTAEFKTFSNSESEARLAADCLAAQKKSALKRTAAKFRQLFNAASDKLLEALDSEPEPSLHLDAFLECERLRQSRDFRSKVVQELLASLSGVQSYRMQVGPLDEEGRAMAVGVIAMSTANSIAGAAQLATGTEAQSPLSSAREELARYVESQIELAGEGAFTVVGTRFKRLSNGEFAVVSFDFSPIAASAAQSQMGLASATQAAMIAAQTNAVGRLAEFAGINYQSKHEATKVDRYAQIVVANDKDAPVGRSSETSTVADVVEQFMRTDSELRTPGIVNLTTRRIKSDSLNAAYFVSAAGWSPSLASNAAELSRAHTDARHTEPAAASQRSESISESGRPGQTYSTPVIEQDW